MSSISYVLISNDILSTQHPSFYFTHDAPDEFKIAFMNEFSGRLMTINLLDQMKSFEKAWIARKNNI